jgi:hypothetical protein
MGADSNDPVGYVKKALKSGRRGESISNFAV